MCRALVSLEVGRGGEVARRHAKLAAELLATTVTMLMRLEYVEVSLVFGGS